MNETLPVPPPPPPLPPRIEVNEVNQARRKWFLDLHPEHLALHSELDPQPLVYTRAEFWDKVDLMEGMRLLTVKKPRSINLQFTPDALREFQQWLGPPSMERLRAVLKQRFNWSMPVAVILVITSLPLSGDPAAGVQGVPFDPFGLALGIALFGVVLWAKYCPSRVAFLFDSLWFVLAAGRIFVNVAISGTHWAWSFLGLFLLSMAWRGFKWFQRFKPVIGDR